MSRIGRWSVVARALVTLVAVSLASGAAGARLQEAGAEETPVPREDVRGQPGYLALDELGIFSPDEISVEVNLAGAMLRLVAAAAGEEEELADVIGGLESVQVRSQPLVGAPPEAVSAAVRAAVGELERTGWQRLLRVRDGEEEVHLLSLPGEGERLRGLTLFVLTPGDEVTAVNLVGVIDPAKIGALAEGLELPGLDPAGRARDDRRDADRDRDAGAREERERDGRQPGEREVRR